MIKQNCEIKLLADCSQHIPYLAQLWYEQIGRPVILNASVEQATQNILKHLNNNSLPLTLVALKDEQPVGMASLRQTDSLRSDLTPWLASLVVDPNYRQCKIGEQLIEAIKSKAIALGYVTLYLLTFNQTIPEWYKKLGWQIIGSDQLMGLPVTVMSIKL